MRPSGSVQPVWMEKPTTLWLPTIPLTSTHYVITCDTGVKWQAIQLAAPCKAS